MIYLFVRTADDRWELLRQTDHPGPDEAFVASIQNDSKLSEMQWVMVICLEPGAITLSELMSYWGMSPGSDSIRDKYMHAFVSLAKQKSPLGGDRWTTASTNNAILAENKLETIAWPKPVFMPLLPQARASKKSWWKCWF